MCGISGYLCLSDARSHEEVLAAVNARLKHRGPDDTGIHISAGAGLAQSRLSIIDLETGHQPLSNEDGSVWITFNGEIYNHHDLRRALLQKGHRFRTASDTEVIVHLYEEYGIGCADHLRGMFAFAVWDARRRRLVLARDHAGKKPIFYTIVDQTLWFASELHALAPVRHARDVDATAIDDYLAYGYIPAPKTIYHEVRKVPPAHVLIVENGAISEQRYWRLTYAPDSRLSGRDGEDALLEQIEEAVRIRLQADVPVGALLSGGVDSSLVVALMARAAGAPVKTFSIGFNEASFDELAHARLVARQYGTDHHELIVQPDALAVLPLLVERYSEPFADASAVPTYYVAKLTRAHVKVALNGDGGDEAFGGYDRYRGLLAMARYRALPAAARAFARAASAAIPDRLPRRNRLSQLRRLIARSDRPLGEQYLGWMTYFASRARSDLYTPEFHASLGDYDADEWLCGLFADAQSENADLLNAALVVDMQSYLPYDLLVKMDIATMANSLEARSPLLDRHVLEFAARLPTSLKVRGTQGKYIVKRLAGRFFPSAHVRRRKMGFGLPVAEWLRGELRPLVHDVLLSGTARVRGIIDPTAVRGLVAAHEAGADYSQQLWALLWLEMWHQQNSSFLRAAASPVRIDQPRIAHTLPLPVK